MTQQQKLREKEVRWARAFLHAIHANETNGYLLLAVLSWMREEGGPWSKNNPLGLKIGNKTLAFASYTASAQYAANRVLKSKDRYLKLLVRRAKDPAGKEATQVEQAMDFLKNLALSNWDAAHYGMSNPIYSVVVVGGRKRRGPVVGWRVDQDSPEKNRLLAGWYALTGIHIPAGWFKDTVIVKTAPPRERPTQKATSAPDTARVTYLDPYAARRFYDERHHAPDDLVLDENAIL